MLIRTAVAAAALCITVPGDVCAVPAPGIDCGSVISQVMGHVQRYNDNECVRDLCAGGLFA